MENQLLYMIDGLKKGRKAKRSSAISFPFPDFDSRDIYAHRSMLTYSGVYNVATHSDRMRFKINHSPTDSEWQM